jgi:hypothetical protein
MPDDLASQPGGLSPDEFVALFKRMNIDVMKQEDNHDYDSMQ